LPGAKRKLGAGNAKTPQKPRRKTPPQTPARTRRSRAPAPRLSRVRKFFVGVSVRLAVVALFALTILTAWLDLTVRSKFEGQRWSLPAQVYARALVVQPGTYLDPGTLFRELDAAGFTRVRQPSRPGQYAASARRVEIRTRDFDFAEGRVAADVVSVEFAGRKVARITDAKRRDLKSARFEPALIARIFPAHKEDRLLHTLDTYPAALVAGLVTVEDREFFDHPGLSARALLRAMWRNLLAGAAVQGGSTLTQQLAKNFFLSNERSLWRKSREALIAVLLEFHYSKETILEAYMNEIHLGQHGARAVHGFGSASQFYFGRPVKELKLHESALLIALARGGSYYNPRRHPRRAADRRNLVLKLMAERGVVTPQAARGAQRQALGVKTSPGPASTRHPAFLQLVRHQLRDHFDLETLRMEGLRVFTTLEPLTQRATEIAMRERLAKLERSRKRSGGHLQGATVVVDAKVGGVLALVGDRDPLAVGFNRALNARRPIGSLAKPFVYLAAVEERGYSRATRVDDSPVSVRLSGGRYWRPRNYDGSSRGDVALQTALAQSLNLASVRVGLDVGVERVARRFREFGIDRDFKAHPSLLLGAIELTPYEVASLYQPLANGGRRSPLKAIVGVTDGQGRSLGRFLGESHRVANRDAVTEVTAMLHVAMTHGTGRSARDNLPGAAVAGKTGTTDDLRDSWFAGFDAKRVAVTWVGLDDNQPAGLSGAAGALRLWTDVFAEIGVTSLPQTVIGERVEHIADAAHAVRNERSQVNSQNAEGCDVLGGWLNRIFGFSCTTDGSDVELEDHSLEVN
jgi:penicillin-binding protein 1B